MYVRTTTIACAVAFVMGTVCLVPPSRAGGAPFGPMPDAPSPQNSDKQDTDKKDAIVNGELKPDVAALIKQSTAIYSAMKSYKHVSEYLKKEQGQDGETNHTVTFTLAMERPNKFCYKSDEVGGSAAVSDGKTFINHRNDSGSMDDHVHTYYTRTLAPASYTGINIVDDVTFTYGTYMIALMLQGNVLADSEVSEALTHATVKAGVTDNGKKCDLLTIPFRGQPVNFYFDATSHLLHKTVDNQQIGSPGHTTTTRYTEIIENVVIDKPLPASTFEYKPPKTSRLIVALPPRTKTQTALAKLQNPELSEARTLINIGRDF